MVASEGASPCHAPQVEWVEGSATRRGTLAGGGRSGPLSWTGRWVDSWGQTREASVLAKWPTRWSEGSWKDGGCGSRENDAGGRGAIRRPLWSSRQEMTTPKGDEDDAVILLLVLA